MSAEKLKCAGQGRPELRKRHAQVRLLPVMVVAAGMLAVLKFAGIATDRPFALMGVAPATAQSTPAPDPDAAPDPATDAGTGNADDAADAGDVVNVSNGGDTDLGQPVIEGTLAEGRRIRLNQPVAPVSEAERALLQSLRARREQLDAREAAIAMRENLIMAAEQRIDDKLEILKTFESKISAHAKKQEEEENAQFASLVSMYENMKPKDAARIFNRLDTPVLVNVARRMNPRKLGPVISKMDGATAERLTIEIARAKAQSGTPAGELESLATN